MPKRKTTSTPKAKAPPRRRARGRQLVWVDQGPLRRQAASACGHAMEQLERARAQWKRYEREDQPAFRRWQAATFGALLSRLRELEALVRDKESLVREVEREMTRSGTSSYREAYTRVLRRRAGLAGDERESSRQSAGPSLHEEEEELSDFEQELLFEEFVRSFLNMNPDRMSDRQYAKMFADFQTKVLGQPPRESAPEPEPEIPLPAEPPPPSHNRLKELYRLLVRRLHPDTRADRDAEVSALWHEVQEAYDAGNLDRLEMLLAFTDIQEKTTGEHTSLFQMRSVLAELRSAFQALQRNLREARKDHAWNFSRRQDRSTIESRVARELETTLAWHESQLRELDALLTHWSAPVRKQAEFPF